MLKNIQLIFSPAHSWVENLSPREASRGYDCISIRDYFFLFTLKFILSKGTQLHRDYPLRTRRDRISINNAIVTGTMDQNFIIVILIA